MQVNTPLSVLKRLYPGTDVGPEQANLRAGSGDQRVRRVHLTAVASIAFRAAMLASTFLYIPLAMNYLGPERYGLWVAMISTMTLLAFADCGIGFGLMNDVAYSIGRDAPGAIRKSISSTFLVLCGIAMVGALLFVLVYPRVPWQYAFRTSGPAQTAEASRAVAVMVGAFLCTLPFTTVQRVQAAHQEGFETQIWETAGVVISVIGLLAAIRMHAGLSVLAIVFSVGTLLAVILNWLFYFFIRRPEERPTWRLVDTRLASKILREGFYFFILQISGVMVFSLDNFIILHYFGSVELGKYTLVVKLFQVIPALAAVWFAPLWPAYADATSRGDHNWVRRTLVRWTMAAGVGCTIAACATAILARWIIHIWTGANVAPDHWLLSGYALNSIIVGCCGSVAAYLNGSNFIRGQAKLVVAATALSIILKLLLCNFGMIAGAVWGTNLAYLLILVPAYSIIIPRLIRTQTTEGAMHAA